MSLWKKRDDHSSPGNEAHVRTVLSTEPPHARIRSERCDCDHGQARGGCTAYEKPGS